MGGRELFVRIVSVIRDRQITVSRLWWLRWFDAIASGFFIIILGVWIHNEVEFAECVHFFGWGHGTVEDIWKGEFCFVYFCFVLCSGEGRSVFESFVGMRLRVLRRMVELSAETADI